MCKFFSFMVDQEGKVYALLGDDRDKVKEKGDNPDSHATIAEYYELDEDETWKFEFPLSEEQIAACLAGDPQKIARNFITNINGFYDGGLPIEDLTLGILDKIEAFLSKSWWAIVEAGGVSRVWMEVFGTDPDFWETGSKLIELPYSVTSDWVIEKLGLEKTERGWGNYISNPYAKRQRVRVVMRWGNAPCKYLAIQRWIHEYNGRREWRMHITPVKDMIKIG